MANIVLDFLHNYQTGERRETEPANAYQYDEGHVLEAVLPEVITACEIHYWIRGMEEADAYTPTSITPNEDDSCTVLGNIPNKYFETNGELRIYIVVTDGTASITTYEGKLHICQRSQPDDYVDDDPENEAVRVITEARAAATTATEKAGEAAASAEQAQEILDSIPEDYTELTEEVSNLKDEFSAISIDGEEVEYTSIQAYFGDNGGSKYIQPSTGADYIAIFPITGRMKITYSGSRTQAGIAFSNTLYTSGTMPVSDYAWYADGAILDGYNIPYKYGYVCYSSSATPSTVTIETFANTDDTLMQAGKAADAKAVGNRLNSNHDELTQLEGDVYNGLAPKYTPLTLEIQNTKQAQLNWNASVMSIETGSSSLNLGVLTITDETRLRVRCTAGSNFKTQSGYICMGGSTVLEYYTNEAWGNYSVEFDVPSGCTAVYINGQNIVPTAEKVEYVNNMFAYSKEESDAKYVANEYCDLSTFRKFGVVGDSYASGELYYGGSYHDKYFNSWGQIMARKHGTTCTNYSSGGLTTRSWLTAAKGLTLMLASDPEDIYYLALGINDVYSLGINYLGSITDITNHESYTDYGDTFYGNYGRIIEQIQAHAPHAKIVMFTCSSTVGNYPAFNNAIIEIAEHYNIPYIVQADDPFFHSTIYTNMSGSHPTSIGYSGMAVAFERLLNKCIVDNLTYFFDLYMYD